MKLFKRVALAFKSRAEKVDRKLPSVDSYDRTADLQDALSAPQIEGSSVEKKSKKAPVGWKLATYDKDSSNPQTMEEEFKRLKVLQSYFVLDTEEDEDLRRITNFAASLFNVPFAFISLVDLGRQWFLSKVGLDVAETSRDIAFCAHVVISRHEILVIPDTLEDVRFQNNPLVTGVPNLRFYAGAALKSPEGYKLGTLCVLDTQPRVFSEEDEMRLLDLSKMVMSFLIARRNRLLLAKSEEVMEATGETFVSTMKSLSEAAELMDAQKSESLAKNANLLRLQEKLCKSAARVLLEQEEEILGQEKKHRESNDWANSALSMYDDVFADEPTTDMRKLFDNVNTVVKSLNGVSAVTLEIVPGVPHKVSGDDLLLFRSVLNLLMHGIIRSEGKSIHLRISCRKPSIILFECEDSGKLIPEDKIASKWKNEKTFLRPIRSLVRSIGGSFGVSRGRFDGMEGSPKAIFWFETPNEVDSAQHEKFSSSFNFFHELQPEKKKGEFLDPFAAALLSKGCISADMMIQPSGGSIFEK